MTPQALASARSGATALRTSDLVFHDEPRIKDLILAEHLGFEKPHNLRKLIERNRLELESYGALPTNILHGGEKQGRGRPGKTYFLNEGQSLVLCALSRTPAAALVRREIITVFMVYRRSEFRGLPAEAVAQLTPPERRALRHLCEHGEVITNLEPDHYRSDFHDEPAQPLLFVTPITIAILDTLCAFEAGLADREDDDPAGGT